MKTPLHGYLSGLLPFMLALATSFAAQSHSPLLSSSKSALPDYSLKRNGSLASLAAAGVNGTATTPPPAPEAITGPSKPCHYSQVTYSTAPVSSAESYTWSIPADWAVLSGQGTTTIKVSVGSVAGQVTVRAANDHGESPAVSLAVAVAPALAANRIEGEQIICLGDAPQGLRGQEPMGGNGMYVYLWEMSTDGVGFYPAPGFNDNRDYSPGFINHTSWFRRTVRSTGGCGSVSNVAQVTVLPPVAHNELLAPPPVCPGEEPKEVTGSAPSGGNGTYAFQWQVQQVDGSYADAADGTQQNYQPRATASNVRLRRLVHSDGCVSVSEPVEVTVSPAPDKPTLLQSGDEVTSSVSGAAYEWVFEGALLAGATEQTVRNAAPGAYMVRVLNEAGCSTYSDSLQVVPEPTGIAESESGKRVALVPNPSGGRVRLVLPEAWPQARVEVLNALGKTVYQARFRLLAKEQELDVSHLPPGTYVLRVLAADRQATQRLVISR